MPSRVFLDINWQRFINMQGGSTFSNRLTLLHDKITVLGKPIKDAFKVLETTELVYVLLPVKATRSPRGRTAAKPVRTEGQGT